MTRDGDLVDGVTMLTETVSRLVTGRAVIAGEAKFADAGQPPH
jgi:hypothetical protein